VYPSYYLTILSKAFFRGLKDYFRTVTYTKLVRTMKFGLMFENIKIMCEFLCLNQPERRSIGDASFQNLSTPHY
jgi:hypothetical protein